MNENGTCTTAPKMNKGPIKAESNTKINEGGMRLRIFKTSTTREEEEEEKRERKKKGRTFFIIKLDPMFVHK